MFLCAIPNGKWWIILWRYGEHCKQDFHQLHHSLRGILEASKTLDVLGCEPGNYCFWFDLLILWLLGLFPHFVLFNNEVLHLNTKLDDFFSQQIWLRLQILYFLLSFALKFNIWHYPWRPLFWLKRFFRDWTGFSNGRWCLYRSRRFRFDFFRLKEGFW